jgi:hypothetical protein
MQKAVTNRTHSNRVFIAPKTRSSSTAWVISLSLKEEPCLSPFTITGIQTISRTS